MKEAKNFIEAVIGIIIIGMLLKSIDNKLK